MQKFTSKITDYLVRCFNPAIALAIFFSTPSFAIVATVDNKPMPKPSSNMEKPSHQKKFEATFFILDSSKHDDLARELSDPKNAKPKNIPIGKKQDIVILVANAPVDSQGISRLYCRFVFRDPTGKPNASPVELCVSNKIPEAPNGMMTPLPFIFPFSRDANDRKGEWTVQLEFVDQEGKEKGKFQIKLLMK